MRPLKNGLASAQKSFSLRNCPCLDMIKINMLALFMPYKKDFDSPLANHLSS